MSKKISKLRLDELLLKLGLVKDLAQAQARIMAGEVIANEHRVDKPSEKFLPDVTIRLKDKLHNFVSRGALKLEHALTTWFIDVKDATCIDVGASTGGFTEMLLNHGAKLVYAIDVGYGQLAEILRNDKRVISMERTHILHVQKSTFAKDVPTLAVIDVSFISLKKILPHVLDLLAAGSTLIALIKPQFEAQPHQVAPGGIVKDELVRSFVVDDMVAFAQSLGVQILGVEKSPITGAKGNIEFLLGLKKPEFFA